MSEHSQDRNSEWLQTLHGFAQAEEWTPRGSWEPRFVRVGTRVGRSGHVFETDGHAGPRGLVVKLFTWGADLPERVVQAFTRDAMTVADLHHSHIAEVRDAGRLGDGTPFVVMERLAGMTLEEAAHGRALPIAEVVPILRGVGAALGAAHAAGIAHGEVRADNIFMADVVGPRPACPKLLDFGVARLVAGSSALDPAVDDAMRVRPGPELGRRASERADQLALAALASRLLGAASGPVVQRVLIRAMSADPSQRFATIAAFVDALEDASLSRAVPVVAIAPAIAVPPIRAAVAAPPIVPAPASPAIGAPAPALAASPAPSSLTQQFFAEGEQLDIAHAAGATKGAQAVADEDEGDQPETAAPSRVPRSRAQMIIAGLIALGSVAVLGWTFMSLASKPEPEVRAVETPPAAAVGPLPGASRATAPIPVAAPERGPRKTTAPTHRAPHTQPTSSVAPPAPSVPAPDVPAPPPVEALQPPRPFVPVPAQPPEAAARPADPAAPPPDVTPGASPDDDGDEAEAAAQTGSETTPSP